MKLISILFLSLILGKGGCDSQDQKDMTSAVVVYTATSRGFHREITIENKQLSLLTARDSKEAQVSQISDKDWNELVTTFGNLKLEELPTLKAPTEKRFYDGAAIATLKITYNDKTYETTAFDHGFPPAEIEKFVNKINALAPMK